ncbi:unnamed protein product [Clavelina lepadiformis]|uniref:Ribosomal RNA-processing protein 7 C-terminal domain-containing protein n=1 Tax=Clavelina lepadiformis TaxID=159417 RepID=A0ABP0GHQ7_CLALP
MPENDKDETYIRTCLVKLGDVNHTLFLKRYKCSNEDDEVLQQNPTLMVLNVPSYCEKKNVRQWFEDCGKILSIHAQNKPGNIVKPKNTSTYFPYTSSHGFQVFYVTFQSHEALSDALHKESVEIMECDHSNEIFHTGITKWCYDYVQSFPDREKLQAEIDRFMNAYDTKTVKEEEDERENDGIPDEEGWIKVTRRGNNPGLSRTELNDFKLKQKIKKRKKDQVTLHSYSYQIRESKRAKIVELRNKFEEDKVKIKAMKNARKFKPFG